MADSGASLKSQPQVVNDFDYKDQVGDVLGGDVEQVREDVDEVARVEKVYR